MTRPFAPLFGIALSAALAACDRGTEVAALPAVPAGAVRLTAEQMATARIVLDTVRLEPVALALAVPGTVQSPDPETARVGAIVEGRVDAVKVLPGDRVRRGDPLVLVHSHEAATALRDLAQSTAELEYAQAAYDRSARLLAAEAVSREEVEHRRMALARVQAEVARSREIVRHLSPTPDGDVVIRSPRPGTVFATHVRPGEAVTVGAPLVDLGDVARLWVTGYVPENASVRFTRGSGVDVRFDALPDSAVPGRVVRIGAAVDSLRRAVEVRVELARVPEGLRPGMFATLLLPAADVAPRAVLPADAVQRTAAGPVVFVRDTAGLFRPRAVRAAGLPDGRMAVDSLPAGLVVVTGGAYSIKAQLGAGRPEGE